MNEVRFIKYPTKYQNASKIIQILTIPCCRSELLYHNIGKGRIMMFVSEKKRLEANFELPSISGHGWDENANICWFEEPFLKI